MENETIRKYPALNTIAGLVGIFARFLIGISFLGLTAGGVLMFTGYSLSRNVGLILIGFGVISVVVGFFLLAYAESIKVVVDIEANTRDSANALALITKGGYNIPKG